MTISIALGIATRSGRPMLSLPRFGVTDVHRSAALIGTGLITIHVLSLLADPYAQLRLIATTSSRSSALTNRCGSAWEPSRSTC